MILNYINNYIIINKTDKFITIYYNLLIYYIFIAYIVKISNI